MFTCRMISSNLNVSFFFLFFLPCYHSRHLMERETGGNSGLFNFLTFRHDWICSAAKPDKRLLKAKSQLMTWPTCSHGQRGGGRERERERHWRKSNSCHAQHLFIQTVHLLCGLSLAGIQRKHTHHTHVCLSHSHAQTHFPKDQGTKGWLSHDPLFFLVIQVPMMGVSQLLTFICHHMLQNNKSNYYWPYYTERRHICSYCCQCHTTKHMHVSMFGWHIYIYIFTFI